MSLWWWIAGGVLALFVLALTGILDLIFQPILRRVLGDDGYREAHEKAQDFRREHEADADAKSAQVEGFFRAIWDMVRGRG